MGKDGDRVEDEMVGRLDLCVGWGVGGGRMSGEGRGGGRKEVEEGEAGCIVRED